MPGEGLQCGHCPSSSEDHLCGHKPQRGPVGTGCDQPPVEDSKMVWSDLDMTCFSESDSERFEDRENRGQYFDAEHLDYRAGGGSRTFGSAAVICIDTGRGSSDGGSMYDLRYSNTGTANNPDADQTSGRISKDAPHIISGDSNFSSRGFCEDDEEEGGTVNLTVGLDCTGLDPMTCGERTPSDVYGMFNTEGLDDSGFNSTTGHI